MRFIIVLLLSTAPLHAQSVYLNYSQWAQMPPGFREMYVAGAFDAISTIAVPAQATAARHFNECVAKAGFSTGRLTEHVKEYGETHPEIGATITGARKLNRIAMGLIDLDSSWGFIEPSRFKSPRSLPGGQRPRRT